MLSPSFDTRTPSPCPHLCAPPPSPLEQPPTSPSATQIPLTCPADFLANPQLPPATRRRLAATHASHPPPHGRAGTPQDRRSFLDRIQSPLDCHPLQERLQAAPLPSGAPEPPRESLHPPPSQPAQPRQQWTRAAPPSAQTSAEPLPPAPSPAFASPGRAPLPHLANWSQNHFPVHPLPLLHPPANPHAPRTCRDHCRPHAPPRTHPILRRLPTLCPPPRDRRPDQRFLPPQRSSNRAP